MIGEWTNHLWQSTVFLIAAGLMAVAFLRKRAQIRYWIWFSASLKFLVPFSLLMSLGSRWHWASQNPIAPPTISLVMEQFTQPFHVGDLSPHIVPGTSMDRMTLALLGVWLCGIGAVVIMRLRVWLRIRSVLRSSTAMEIPAIVPVRSCPGVLEPGVFGFWRPILLLPADIRTRLTPHQLEAVVTHELCHVRRRDNLTSVMHMIVEAVFWFYPPVWWIGSRLVIERERACDEEVLRLGNEPQVYAEGILNVCRVYLESPLRCVSGVTGSDLKKRIHAIVTGRVPTSLNWIHKAVLVSAAMVALAMPLFVGMIVNASPARAQSQAPEESPSAFAARGNINKGVQAFRSQNYASAIEFFKKATELDPGFPNAYLYLAMAYAQQFVPGLKDEANQKVAQSAIESFDKVLQLDPGNKIAIAGKAGIYQNNAQYDKAREAYLKNAEVDPQNHLPFYAVGSVDWIIVHNSAATLTPDERHRLIDEGLHYLDKSIALDPDYEDSYWYENLMFREESLLLKQKAGVTQDQIERQALLANAAQLDKNADEWSNRALDIRKKNSGRTGINLPGNRP